MSASDQMVPAFSAGPFEETENEKDFHNGIWKQPRSALGIQASPRKTRGATDFVYSKFIAGMQQSGTAVDTIYLADSNISPCAGCFKCWLDEKNKCPLKDDMEQIIERVSATEVLILATPLYMDGMSGLLKNFVDRLMPLNHPSIFFREGRSLHPCCRPRMPNLVAISVCGFYEKENFEPLVQQLSRLSVSLHMPLLSTVLRPESLSIRSPDAANQIIEVAEALHKAGQRFVMDGEVSTELLDTISQPLLTVDRYSVLGKTWWKR